MQVTCALPIDTEEDSVYIVNVGATLFRTRMGGYMDGRILRKLRNWRGISIREAARRANLPGIDPNVLGSVERGTCLLPSDQTDALLASLGVTDKHLLSLAVGILEGKITTWEQVRDE